MNETAKKNLDGAYLNMKMEVMILIWGWKN